MISKVKLVPIPELIKCFHRTDQCHVPTHLLEMGSVPPNNIDHTGWWFPKIIRALLSEERWILGGQQKQKAIHCSIWRAPQTPQHSWAVHSFSLSLEFLSLCINFDMPLPWTQFASTDHSLPYKWCLWDHSVGTQLSHNCEPHPIHFYTGALRVLEMLCPNNAYLCLNFCPRRRGSRQRKSRRKNTEEELTCGYGH